MASDRLRDIKAFEDTKAGVKGLVDAGVTTIPAIFRHLPDTIPVDASRLAIPVIDLARITSHRAELVAEVKAAAETVGFIQAVNHGVPGEVMSEMLAAVRGFNEEPAEARRPYHTRDTGRRVRYHSNYDLFRSPAANWRDTLVLDMAPTGPAPEEIPPACRGVAVEFIREVQRLGGTLFELLSEALGLHPGYLQHDAGCLEGLTVVGHYYPASPQPQLTMGLARHTDPSILTVLLQDTVGGLQVLFRDGEQPVWVDVPAEPRALIVNVGDLLQLLSNDRFKSVEHRVVSKSVTSRVSVASFFRLHGAAAAAKVCAPIKELLVAGSGPPRYRSATEAELIDHYRDKAPDATSTLDHFRV